MRLRPRSLSAISSLRLFGIALSAALAPTLVTSVAAAEGCEPKAGISTCVDADNLWPHPGGGEFFSIGSTRTTPAGRSSFGLVASYFSRPIGLRVASASPSGTAIYAIDNALDASFLWAVGVLDRLDLTVSLPVTLYQDGGGIGGILGADDELPRSAIRDGRVGLSFAIVPRPRAGADALFALTSRLDLGLPFGNKDAFASAGTVTLAPSLVADLRVGRFLAAIEAGARIRGERSLGTATIGSQMSGSLGASIDVLSDHKLTIGAEAFGLYTLAEQKAWSELRSSADASKAAPPLIPLEWIASVSSAPALGGDVAFSVGGGGTIPTASDSAPTTPRFRVDLSVRYAPTGRDVDADGVLDRDDRCLAVPEDRDGFQDEDGCPEPDNDGDRIPDTIDRCRDQAETVDGFQDSDGCPDLDDDGDGIPDESDKCRNVAEDKDGFEDNDGCPELDNDGDGIPDKVDVCPNGAEDKDGFKDADGCPDPDNDLDQIADDRDQCPDLAEDRDGFLDDDGCPEPDNDEDGVLDGDDKCPMTPETINGDADGDGCPEPGARSLVSLVGDRVVVDKPARFAAGRAEPPKELAPQARMIAQLLRGRGAIDGVIVEAYADRSGDTSLAAMTLADKRATALKSALVAAGLPADRITAATGDLGARRPAQSPQFEITARRAAPETTEKKRP